MTRAGTVGLALTSLAVLTLLGSLVLGLLSDPATPPSGDPATPVDEPRLRVEVLNAAGIPGLARDATGRLRDAGFDVVYYGNARSFAPESSLVLDRVGRPDDAREVARALDIPRVLSRPDTTLFLEVTVVLGRDWVGAPREEADSVDGGG